jgi:hypothetical protein
MDFVAWIIRIGALLIDELHDHAQSIVDHVGNLKSLEMMPGGCAPNVFPEMHLGKQNRYEGESRDFEEYLPWREHDFEKQWH